MAVFSDSALFYTTLQTLFARIEQIDTNVIDDLLSTRMVFRIDVSNPSALITINGRTKPLQIDYGPSKSRPDLTLSTSADTLHLILSDSLSVKQAYLNKEIMVRGPFWKIMPLVKVFEISRQIYPQIVAENGLNPK